MQKTMLRHRVERSEDEQEALGVEVSESTTKEPGKYAIVKPPNIPENG